MNQPTKSKVVILNSDNQNIGDANLFVFSMLKEAIKKGASDVHIDLEIDDQGQI